jgi:hypothetical protein
MPENNPLKCFTEEQFKDTVDIIALRYSEINGRTPFVKLSISDFQDYLNRSYGPELKIQFWLISADQVLHQSNIDPVIDCFPIFLERHYKYGKKSIIYTGTTGIAVRCIDKLARIERMTEHGLEDTKESIKDSYIDLYNYCVLAYLLITVDGIK